MNFQFHYDFPVDEEMAMVFVGAYAAALSIGLLIRLTLFIIRGVGLHTIAKRRELQNPWLVWVPVADQWVIGSFSDQYRYLVKDEITNRRKYLLGLSVGNLVLGLITAVTAAVTVGKLIVSGAGMSDGQMAAALMGPVMTVLVISAVLGALSLVEFVLKQMCLYDLYRSCDPGNAMAYTILAILFSVLEPIFLIVLRKRDDGMPPRRDIPVEHV